MLINYFYLYGNYLKWILLCIYGCRTIGMRTIGMEDNWHAENWHGGQLALTFLIVSYLIRKKQMKNVYFQTHWSFYIIFFITSFK